MINVLRKSYVNFRGWSTKRKLLLIESDDWGSIRMPNREVYNLLLSKGLPVDRSRYSKFDTLESQTDLERLFETLAKVKDKNGNAASLTANYLVANPDFEKIKKIASQSTPKAAEAADVDGVSSLFYFQFA